MNLKLFIVITLLIYLNSSFCFKKRDPTHHEVSFESKDPSLHCNRTLTERDSKILSPGYGINYPNSLKCFWHIKINSNKSISLKFHDFHLENYRDFLTIYDDTSSTGLLMGNFTGDDLPPMIVSSSNHLFLQFTTDHINTVNKTGFNITFQAIEHGCGGRLDKNEHAIFSPLYPKSYPNNITCIWKISVNRNKFIILNIHDFETEKHDILSVYDQVVFNPSYGNLIPVTDSALAQFSGHFKYHSKSFISKRNEVFLEFKSNENIEGKGFFVNYTTKDMGMNSPIFISVPYRIKRFTAEQNLIVYNQGIKTAQLIDINSHQLLYFRPELNQIVLMSKYRIHDDIHFNLKSMTKTYGMTIDWVHSLVYWIDMKWRQIKVFHLNKSDEQNIYTICNISKNGDPRDLIFNGLERTLVWIAIGEASHIWYSNPDCSNQKILYYGTTKQPFHLTIEYEKQNYYFIDITDYSLYSIDFNGQNEKLYLKSREFFQEINSMFVMNNDLYLSDEHRIYRIPELESRIETAELLFETNPNLIKSHNFYEFKTEKLNDQRINGFRLQCSDSYLNKEKNQCLQSNCSHLCLPTATSFKCVCPLGYTLQESNKCMNSSKQSSGQMFVRYSDRHAMINSFLIALLFVSLLVLFFYMRSFQTQSVTLGQSKGGCLRLMVDDQDNISRYGDEL